MNLGQRIKRRREELNMTQEELSKKLGYTSRSSIAKIENNANGMTQSKIVDFANALHTTPEYLLGWEKPFKQTKPDENIESFVLKFIENKKVLEVAKLLFELDDRQLETALSLLSSLK